MPAAIRQLWGPASRAWWRPVTCLTLASIRWFSKRTTLAGARAAGTVDRRRRATRWASPRWRRTWETSARSLFIASCIAGLDTIERNVERYSIDCDLRRCGQVTAARSDRAPKQLGEDVRWLHAVTRDTTPRLLDRREIRDRLGFDGYVGGYLDVRGAGIHSLNYVRGLALGLAKRG